MSQKIFTAIGMMSGTSLDGIDASIIKTDGSNFLEFGESIYFPYEPDLKIKIKKLIAGDLNNLSEVENEITCLHFEVVKKLLTKASHEKNSIDLIGFHGQSIAHDPKKGITNQVGDGNLLAKLTGINVVYDFRTNDVRNGGEGAPLVPVFLRALKEKVGADLFLNIGGVANICYVGKEDLVAFDIGFGNAPMNDFTESNLGILFDKNGDLARAGKPNLNLVTEFLKDEFFSKAYPKSLDRNHFEFEQFKVLSLEDALATMAEIIAKSVALSIKQIGVLPKNIIVSGGGAHNLYLIERIEKVASIKVLRLSDFDLNGDFIEAQAFGYLAVRSFLGLPISFPKTTGVKQPLVGGVFCHA